MDNAFLIADYCEKKLINKIGDFEKYSYKEPCFIFTLIRPEKLSERQKEYFQKVNFLLMYQRIRNDIITKEIADIFNNRNNLVGIKGIFLQNIYYNKNYTRLFGDIDLLTVAENGYKEYRVLRNSGYTLIKNSHYFENNHFTISLLREKYFSNACHIELIKKIDGKEKIVLELHGNLNRCNSGNVSFNVGKMLARAKKVEIGNSIIKILSPEDNIAYLMFHSIKHLSYTSFIRAQNKTLNLQDFYDIVQIIDNETIDWDLFLNIVCEFKILPFVSLYIKIFTDIFDNKIPQNIVNAIHKKTAQSHFFWKPIYDMVIVLSPDKIITGNFCDIPFLDSIYNNAKNSSTPVKVWHDFCARQQELTIKS